MKLRWVAAGIVAAVLATGCRSASSRWPAGRAEAPPLEPNRWERAACRMGEYPAELDARALARARSQDLRARRAGTSTAFATARLESERAAFDARCSAWRIGAAGDGI